MNFCSIDLFLPVPHCFNYCGFIIHLNTGESKLLWAVFKKKFISKFGMFILIIWFKNILVLINEIVLGLHLGL